MANYNAIRYNVPYSEAGSLKLIKTLTASAGTSDLSFVNGFSDVVFDSTYKEYLFIINNFHPNSNAIRLKFNASDDTSSHSYDIAKTTTMFQAYHNEGDTTAAMAYETGTDEAQSTGTIFLGNDTSNANDACMSGYLQIFNPSSTTYVKHFMSRAATLANGEYAVDTFKTGYFNTTSAITAIQFTPSSGDMDDGTIQLFGVS